MSDLISRQAAIDAKMEFLNPNVKRDTKEQTEHDRVFAEGWNACNSHWIKEMENLPSAQPEQLTDKEQRIFLAAMGREEKVCKQVDEECRDCREAYEDSLVKTCHEIIRKVKGALWT